MVKIKQKLVDPYHETIRWTKISLSEIITRGKRFEASYYDDEGKKARKIIQDSKYEKLILNSPKGFSKVWHRPRFKRIFIEEGIPIFTASQTLDWNPKASKFVSSKTNTKLKPLYLQKDQITLTCSGSVGFASLVTKTLDKKLFSHDLLRIECHNENDIGYVYAFLKTKIGFKLVSTNNYGSVVTHIEPEHLSTLDIPNPSTSFKNKIDEMIRDAFKLRDDANDLLLKADNLLHERLNLKYVKKLIPKYIHKNSIRNFKKSNSLLDHRFDASYHLPIVDKIILELKKTNLEIYSIGDKKITKDIILPGRFKRIYVSEKFGIPFIGGRDTTQFDPSEIKYLSLKHHSKRIKKELTLNQNEILITCSGTVGKTLLTPKHYQNWAASQHIIRIIPNDEIHVGFLTAYLSSDYGSELIKHFIYGSVVDEIDDNHISQILIPLPRTKIMNEIGELVLKANEKRTKAYEIEHNAIQKVENLIINQH